MKLIYGTTNPSKIHFMQRRVRSLGIELLSLDDVHAPCLDIDESGSNPLDNARIKAEAYYKVLRKPVFSCDSGLYIHRLDDARQPGVHVRNVNGKRLTDDEMIAYYSCLAAEMGGRMTARYQNAICLVVDDGNKYEWMGEDIASEPFYIVAKPHEKRREGVPIDSISVHIKSEKYYYDIEGYGEKYSEGDDGFTAFFKRTLMEGDK